MATLGPGSLLVAPLDYLLIDLQHRGQMLEDGCPCDLCSVVVRAGNEAFDAVHIDDDLWWVTLAIVGAAIEVIDRDGGLDNVHPYYAARFM
jgi:hypothetical protein